MLQYEDETLQAIALSVIPEERLRMEAKSALAGERAAQLEGCGGAGNAAADQSATPSEEDTFVRRLLSWFKRDFFTWVRNVQDKRVTPKDKVAIIKPTICASCLSRQAP